MGSCLLITDSAINKQNDHNYRVFNDFNVERNDNGWKEFNILNRDDLNEESGENRRMNGAFLKKPKCSSPSLPSSSSIMKNAIEWEVNLEQEESRPMFDHIPHKSFINHSPHHHHHHHDRTIGQHEMVLGRPDSKRKEMERKRNEIRKRSGRRMSMRHRMDHLHPLPFAHSHPHHHKPLANKFNQKSSSFVGWPLREVKSSAKMPTPSSSSIASAMNKLFDDENDNHNNLCADKDNTNPYCSSIHIPKSTSNSNKFRSNYRSNRLSLQPSQTSPPPPSSSSSSSPSALSFARESSNESEDVVDNDGNLYDLDHRNRSEDGLREMMIKDLYQSRKFLNSNQTKKFVPKTEKALLSKNSHNDDALIETRESKTADADESIRMTSPISPDNLLSIINKMDDNQTRNIKGEGHHHQKPSKTFESIKKIAEGSENVSEDDEEDEDYGEAEQYRPEQYANNHNQNQLKYFDERFKNGSDFSKVPAFCLLADHFFLFHLNLFLFFDLFYRISLQEIVVLVSSKLGLGTKAPISIAKSASIISGGKNCSDPIGTKRQTSSISMM